MQRMGKACRDVGGTAVERTVNTMKMLTPAEVAERLNISYDTALHMINHSGIAYLKIGRQYRVSEAVINELTSQDETVIIDYDDAG